MNKQKSKQTNTNKKKKFVLINNTLKQYINQKKKRKINEKI